VAINATAEIGLKVRYLSIVILSNY